MRLGKARARDDSPESGLGQEWRLRSILEATHAGTWEWNVQTGQCTFDHIWASIVGYTLDELAPCDFRTWERFTHPDDLALSNERIRQHFEGEIDYYECDVRMRHKDGRWVWVQDRGRVTSWTADGKPLLMFGTHIDITARKDAEEALRQSEQRFYLSLENASDAIFLADEQAWVYCNQAAVALLGAESADQIIGTEFMSYVHPEYRARVEHSLDAREPGARAPHPELKLVRLDGSSVDVEVTGTVIQAGDQLLREVFVRDITERRRAEAALRQSHDLMAYVLEHARSAIAVHDRDMKYIYVSQRYLDEYGVTEREVIGKHHYDVFPDLPEKWRIVHRRALEGDISSAEDDPYVREDGRVDWTRWECRPWHEADGSIGGIIVYTEVINAQKRTEERLLQYQAQLRALAAELVASGEREQRRLATELHDGLGQLLVVAKMEAQAIAEEACDEPRMKRALSLAALLGQMLEEARALTAQLAPTVLLGRGLGESLAWLARRYADLYRLECSLEINDEAESLGDDVKMFVFRIVRESLNNVARHGRTLSASVEVRRTWAMTTVVVRDEGIGFDPAVLGDPTVTGGFGLFSLNEECMARGGSLDVSSALGKGTTITALLPNELETIISG